MATALAEPHTLGSTLPRLYTPPLEGNCRGPEPDHSLKVGEPKFNEPQECLCGCGLNPQTSWGFSCIYFLQTFWGWALLPWQQWLYIHALEKRPDGTGFRFQTLVVLVGRQQGKTRWIKGLGLWRLFMNEYGLPGPYCPAARLAVIAAQNLDYAETMLAEVVDEIRDHRLFTHELINHRVVNGGHRAVLTNRRIWRAATASTRGARSLSVDLAMMDELRTHTTWDAYNAIAPTTTARPYSQVVCTSNAGEKRSLVLRSLREAANQRIITKNTESAKVGMWEWSVPMDVDPRDPTYWHLALPAMGRLNDFTIDTVLGFFEAMQYKNMPGFQTEYLALDIETPVLTTSCWKSMGTIEVGDEVYHPDGHPVAVTRVTPIYEHRPCYEVTTTDGRSVVADVDHQWLVQDRRSNRGWETLSTGQLLTRGLTRNMSGGRFAYRLPGQHEIISKPVELPIDPYLLGAWLGDGTTGKAEITCAESEADELTALLPVNITSERRIGNARYINFRTTPRKSRDGFPSHCRALGIWDNKHIPGVYLSAGTEQRLALLQGLCDTDGSIDLAGRVRFCATRKVLADQVLYLARSLGWRATLTEGVSRYKGKVCGPSYCVAWTHDASEPSPFRLRRKLARINMRPSRGGERTAISIRSINPVPSRPVRCITVDSPDSLWLAGRDLLPTRNCQWVDSLDPGIIPAEFWQQGMDRASRREEGADVYAALDVNYDRSHAYVAICAKREDGYLHVEIVQAARGTDWVVPWLKERRDKFKGVAVQKTGAPASGLIPDLQSAGVPVVEWGPGAALSTGCGLFYDKIVQGEVYHRPSLVLDRAAASSLARRVGDAWIFDRRNSPVDASPLVACAAAVWLSDNCPDQHGPEIHAWPSDETLDQWEQEAREKWGDTYG